MVGFAGHSGRSDEEFVRIRGQRYDRIRPFLLDVTCIFELFWAVTVDFSRCDPIGLQPQCGFAAGRSTGPGGI